jgi:hypothetical protein
LFNLVSILLLGVFSLSWLLIAARILFSVKVKVLGGWLKACGWVTRVSAQLIQFYDNIVSMQMKTTVVADILSDLTDVSERLAQLIQFYDNIVSMQMKTTVVADILSDLTDVSERLAQMIQFLS